MINPEKILQWCITFKKYEYISDQRSGVGTPVYIEEKAAGPLMKMHFEITEWKENEKLSLRMVSGNGVKSYEQTWSIESVPPGSRFTFMEKVELPFGFIGKLMGLIAQKSSEATVDKMLQNLKALTEA